MTSPSTVFMAVRFWGSWNLVLSGFGCVLLVFLLCSEIKMREEIMSSGKMMNEGNSGIVVLGTVKDHPYGSNSL